MAASFKAMVVVLVIATAIFQLAKPIALRFSAERDFVRRRNVWLALTVAGFLSPNFWVFVLIAAPLLFWAGRKDPNPVALYLLLLFVIPQIDVEIPVVGIQSLFPLDIYRLLSFCVLIPAAWRVQQLSNQARGRGLAAMDILLLAYGALQVLLLSPYVSLTVSLRGAFLFAIDVYVLYFVVSRTCAKRESIVDALAAFWLACAILAPLAVFETVRHWLLYVEIAGRWSHDPTATFYLLRASALRAQVSAGHALALGYLLAIGFGFWLYLKSYVRSMSWRVAVVALLWLGLLAAYSRGPWVGALGIYLVYSALGPRAAPRLVKAIFAVVLGIGVLSLSPLGERVLSVLPFFGGAVDAGSIAYRQQLAARSWQLFQQHPFLGDQSVLSKLQDLRQGQGIVDLVNTYAEVALFDGLVGLTLFMGFILLGLSKTYRFARRVSQSDPELGLLGFNLVACIVGTLIMIGTCSFILGYSKIFYVLAGLATAYSQLGRSYERRPVTYGAPARSPRRSAPAYRHVRGSAERR